MPGKSTAPEKLYIPSSICSTIFNCRRNRKVSIVGKNISQINWIKKLEAIVSADDSIFYTTNRYEFSHLNRAADIPFAINLSRESKVEKKFIANRNARVHVFRYRVEIKLQHPLVLQ